MRNDQLKAFDLARWVIKKAASAGILQNNLKLQRILYFSQAFYICHTDRPLFREPLEAWSFGPVVPEVYLYYKTYGSHHLPDEAHDPALFPDESLLKEMLFLNKFIHIILPIPDNQLDSKSRKDEPWIEAFHSGTSINPYLMKLVYSKRLKRLLTIIENSELFTQDLVDKLRSEFIEPSNRVLLLARIFLNSLDLFDNLTDHQLCEQVIKKSFLYHKKVIINETDGINDLKDRKEKNEEKVYP